MNKTNLTKMFITAILSLVASSLTQTMDNQDKTLFPEQQYMSDVSYEIKVISLLKIDQLM